MTSLVSDELSSPLSAAPSDASDSEVSFLSRSPSPPTDNLAFATQHSHPASSSSSQQSSAKNSPGPEDMPSPPSSNDDDPRPRKRRKIADPKERVTQHLDLRTFDLDDNEPQLRRLLDVLYKKRKIVVVAGAGISVSAGIPDFRSATGLFTSLKKEHKLKSSGKDLFDASVYQDDASTSTFHAMVRELSRSTKSAQPTAFHHLLATLAQEGRLMRLYTQNVDGIDTSLPPLSTQVPFPKKGPWPKTVQLHGGLDHMVCSKCHALSPFDADKFDGPTPPPCPSCVENDAVRQVAEKRSHGVGCLRPRMVLYNEHNPDDEAIGSCAASDLRFRPDAIIVAGTTLKVPGVRRIVREMCKTVRDRRDGVTIWVNNDPEPIGKDLENVWDLVVRGPCDEVARHANMRKWDDPSEYKEVSDEDVSKAKEHKRVEVVIGTPRKPGVFKSAGQLTPGQSPRILPCTIKSEPGTPSKRGRKRKSDAQMDLFGKVAGKAPAKKASVQPKKAPPKTKAKATKQSLPGINSVFKATKRAIKPSGKATAKAAASSPSVLEKSTPSLQENRENVKLTISLNTKPTPRTPKRTERLTKIKEAYINVMAPLSDADRRNNHSPKRPEVESFTPTKLRTADEQLQDEYAHSVAASPTVQSRPSSANSFRDQTLTPCSIPRGMGDLIHT